MQETVIKLEHITREFPGVLANDDVSLEIHRGEVFALVGENGAGKSTLMNIIYGIFPPTDGSVYIRGKKVETFSPKNAIDMGIGMVHQHFMLVPSFTVAQNIVMSREPRRAGLFFDNRRAEEITRELVREYGLNVDPSAQVQDISVGVQQRVEILKALYRGADILILDEPTAVLTPQEVTDLFKVLRRLKESGKTILIITHKLKETLALADTVTILRKGQVITSVSTKDVDESKLAELMVGRIVSFQAEKNEVPGEHKVVMALRGATVVKEKRNALDGVSLEIRAGEILGIAGVEGNGQTELIDALTGLQRLHSGSIELEGKALHAARITPRAMLEAGVGHIPEDRGKRGFVGSFTIAENIVLGYHRKREFSNHGLIRLKERDAFAQKVAEQYDVRMDSIRDTVGSLSGGNQQKVIIGRVFAQDPKVIIAAQPTRGVDIGAIEYIHAQILKMRDAGKAILLISADLEELTKLSDEIAVLYAGRIVDKRPAKDYDEKTLGALMTGHAAAEEKEA